MSRRRAPQTSFALPQLIGGQINVAVPANLAPIRRVIEVWPQAVGERLARYVVPARLLANGTLIVHARDASWVHAVTLEQRSILAKLDEHLIGTAPSALRAEIGPVDTRSEQPASIPTEIDPSAQIRADAMVQTVTDPRLRAALRRAIARSLSRQKAL